VVIGVAVALVGCDSSQSPGAQARSVVQGLYADLATGNGKAVCALLTTGAREQIVRAAQFAPAHLSHATDCAAIVTGMATAPRRAQLKGFSVGKATVARGAATVVVRAPDGSEGHLPLVKTASGWRISDIAFR
jgi:hypothetical protein